MKGIRFLIALVLTAALVQLYEPTPALTNENSVSATQAVQAKLPEQELQAQAQDKALTEQQPITQPEAAPEAKTVAANTPTCASEVTRYGWNTQVAHAVMMAESSNNPGTHNDTASTGDYSIGCFQINLKGSSNLRAKYRDSVRAGYTGPMTVSDLEQWLKNAKNNVAVAHIMWSDQGWKPWGNLTCKVKVRCDS